MDAVVRWYRDMAPIWALVEPCVRRQLVLCVHRWLLERVLLPLSHGEEPAAHELRPFGKLLRALSDTVPPAEGRAWKSWIELACTELRQALARPPDQRTTSWAQSLFLIPRDIPFDHPAERAGGGPLNFALYRWGRASIRGSEAPENQVGD